MIYTVTFNPALDYILTLDDLCSKDINRAKSEQLCYGGKGINVSVILSRLGIDNTALGFLAGFSGSQLEKMLTDENVKSDFIYLKNGFTRINVKIRADREMDINAQGPDISSDDVECLFEKLNTLSEGDCLVLAGSIPNSLTDDIYERIMGKLKNKGIRFVVDATGELLLNVLKYEPFIIKPNHHELGELFGVELTETDDIIRYAQILQDKGAKNVLVSRGKDGALLMDENGTVHKIGNVPGKIVSSVGCGDSMVAGFIAGYEQKRDYAYALRLGAACGNATAFSATLADENEIRKMMNNKFLK